MARLRRPLVIAGCSVTFDFLHQVERALGAAAGRRVISSLQQDQGPVLQRGHHQRVLRSQRLLHQPARALVQRERLVNRIRVDEHGRQVVEHRRDLEVARPVQLLLEREGSAQPLDRQSAVALQLRHHALRAEQIRGEVLVAGHSRHRRLGHLRQDLGLGQVLAAQGAVVEDQAHGGCGARVVVRLAGRAECLVEERQSDLEVAGVDSELAAAVESLGQDGCVAELPRPRDGLARWCESIREPSSPLERRDPVQAAPQRLQRLDFLRSARGGGRRGQGVGLLARRQVADGERSPDRLAEVHLLLPQSRQLRDLAAGALEALHAQIEQRLRLLAADARVPARVAMRVHPARHAMLERALCPFEHRLGSRRAARQERGAHLLAHRGSPDSSHPNR